MAFLDWASTLITQSKYKLLHGVESVKNGSWGPLAHINSKLGENGELRQWLSARNQESQRISQERTALEQQYEQLKTGYPQMSHEQRAAEMSRVTWQRPSILRVAYAHPAVQLPLSLVTKPVKVFAHALWGTGNPTPAHITAGSNTALLTLALLYHLGKIFFFTLTVWNLIVINFILMMFVIFFIFDSSERNGDTYRTLFLWVFILEILIPYVTNEFSILQQIDFIRLYVANGFIILTWIYYAILIRGKDVNVGLTRIVRIAIIFFWVGVLVFFVGTSIRGNFTDIELDTANADQWYAAKLVWNKFSEGYVMLWDGLKSTVANFQDIFSMRMKQATGEYYYGVVEENENEKLGVYLEDLTASKIEYEKNEQVTVYASLLARTLDDAISVNVACYAGSEKNRMNGSVYPDDSFEIFNLQQEELDCSFEKLPEGTNKITYTAQFNFQTIGYLKRYFTDRDALTAATRQGIDLLDEYQIQDQAPVAHYTNGPVAIGMGPEEPLLGISESYTVKPRLALTLDGSQGWAGVIAALDEVVLLIPSEMSLDVGQCTDDDWTTYTVDDCISSEETYNSKVAQECGGDESCIEEICTAQLEGYNAYTLAVDKPEYKDIKDYITISCRLNIDDVSSLLGATPISTHYFYVKTRYDYQLSDDTSVTVVESEEAQSSGLPGDSRKSLGNTPTFSNSEKDELLQYIFYNYEDELFAAQKEHTVYACDLAALIAQTSSADHNYYLDGKTGLMGVTPIIATQVASQADLDEKYDLDDPATNIDVGAAYVHNIIQSTGQFSKEVAKIYYAGIYMLTSDDVTASNSQIDLYAALVDNYATLCREMGLQNTPQQTVTSSDPLQQGSVSYDYANLNEQHTVNVSLATSTTSGKELRIIFVHPATAFLYYGATDLIDYYKVENLSVWRSFDEYPFAQIFFNTETTEIEYRYLTDFVMNPDFLLEDKEYALVPGMLYVKYDGTDIDFSLANNKKDSTDRDEICSILWYPNIAYATCENAGGSGLRDPLPGLIVRNLETWESTPGQGYAKVQIEWNTQEQLMTLED